MSELSPVFKQSFFDLNGAPLAGGFLYSYAAGTTTPLATYTDQSGGTPNTNPVVLDANGQADVWLGADNYKFVLTDSNAVPQWTVDNVQSIESKITAAIGAPILSVDINYTQLQIASTSNAISAFTVPAGSILSIIGAKHIQAFAGGSISAMYVQLGPSGAYDEFIEHLDVFQAVGDQAFDNASPAYIGSFANPTIIYLNAVSTGANLSALAQGKVRVYYKYENL